MKRQRGRHIFLCYCLSAICKSLLIVGPGGGLGGGRAGYIHIAFHQGPQPLPQRANYSCPDWDQIKREFLQIRNK